MDPKIRVLKWQVKTFNNFFSVIGVRCGMKCICYYSQYSNANVFDCSNTKLDQIPANVPNGTSWIVLYGNTITKLCDEVEFYEGVTFLNISSNNVEEICPEFIFSLFKRRNITQLDFSLNRLQYLPETIKEAKHLTKIWLNGNDFMCDCTMLWMIDWLANFTTPAKENVVQNYQNVTCANGILDGIPIYQLNRVTMGCFPDRMPSWEIALLVITGIAVIAIAFLIVILFKKREEIKLRLLRDKDETLEGKEFDALISYR